MAGPPSRSSSPSRVAASPAHQQPAARRSVHITVNADPSQPSTALPQPRIPTWLAPRTSATSPFGIALPSLPTLSAGDAEPPSPVKQSRRGRFQRSIDGVLRNAEIVAWRHGLWRSTLAPPPARHRRPRRLAALWARLCAILASVWSALCAILASVWSALWVDEAPPTRFRTTSASVASFAVEEQSSGHHARRRKSSLGNDHDHSTLLSALVETPRRKVGLSRFGYLVSLALFALGFLEILSRTRTPSLHNIDQRVRRQGKTALDALGQLGLVPDLLDSHDKLQGIDDPLALRGLWLTPLPHHLDSAFERGNAFGDTTAIVLSWSRLDSLRLIVANLCRYDFFASIMIWHNNPNIPIMASMFVSETCPISKLRIFRSPGNVFFVSRFWACVTASTPHCYFQDDDWLVGGLRGLYAQYKRGLDGQLTVATTNDMASLYGWEWCFYNPPLHTCFAWLGTGSFTSKAKVADFLDLMTAQGLPYDELAMADNYFATSTNEPPYVISMIARDESGRQGLRGGLVQIKTVSGFSSHSNGLARNKSYIRKGLSRVIELLEWLDTSPDSMQEFGLPQQIDMSLALPNSTFTSIHKSPILPHPHFSHVRAASPLDTHLFICSPSLLAPPDSVRFPVNMARSQQQQKQLSKEISLEEWESRLGWKSKAWSQGDELDADGERWAEDWSYENAIDGDMRTAWRSRDVIQKGDYFGLMLIAPINPNIAQSIQFHIVLEDVGEILPHLYLEVSVDGYTWQSATQVSSTTTTSSFFECRSTQHTSRKPDSSFPASSFMSNSAYSTRKLEQEALGNNFLTGWIRRRKRRAIRLQDCSILIKTTVSRMKNPDEPTTMTDPLVVDEALVAQGWQFVRVVSNKTFTNLGWGLYEVKLGRSP